MDKILITGISGFIGSSIAESLVKKYNVSAVIRKSTNLWRCKEFLADVNFKYIEQLSDNNVNQMEEYDAIIHCAWDGVENKDRDNWIKQIGNISILFSLINKYKTKKIICFGSQAEYGIEGRLDENIICKPNTSYGAAKAALKDLLQTFCAQKQIELYWLRIFSLYGPKQDTKWFIPNAIIRMLRNEPLDLTKCEQKYDYLFIKDLVDSIGFILENKIPADVYNLSGNSSHKLYSVIEKIKDIVNSNSTINFGKLPYRQNQPMHIEGDSSKFLSRSSLSLTPIEDGLRVTVEYYRNIKKKENNESV